MSENAAVDTLCKQLDTYVREDDVEGALDVYASLEVEDADEARWPHRKGDLLLRLKRHEAAIEAYERAVDLYAAQGYVARAAAMAKVILGLDPTRMDVIERVDGNAALELRMRRESSVVARLPTAPPPTRPRGEDVSARVAIVSLAPMLAKAADASDDEVRFDESTDTLALDLSDFEDPKGPESTANDPTALSLSRMPSVPLLAGIPKGALARMLEVAELVELTDAQTLVRAGEASDALFVLIRGEAEVRVPGLSPGSVVLGEGEIVGETTLLPGVTRKADVVARGALSALRLSRDSLLDLIRLYPAIGDVLYDLLTKRLLGNLMRTHELFAAFDSPTRFELARLFELRRAQPGTKLLEVGKRSDGIYVPLLGTLSATFADGRVVDVPAGRLLGEQSLLTRAPSVCTVEATSDALVLRLSAMKFTELAMMFPPVLAHLTDLAASGSFDDVASRWPA